MIEIAPATIPGLLADAAQAARSRTALIAPDRTALEYGALEAFVGVTADQLSSCKLGRRDRVALLLPSGPEFVTAFLAITARAVCAPLDPALRADELRGLLEDVRPRAALVDDRHGEAAAIASDLGIRVLHAAASDCRAGIFRLDVPTTRSRVPGGLPVPDDAALLMRTSGTTARPKTVLLTHRQIARSAANIARTLDLSDADRYLNVMPLFHVHGMMAALATLGSGGAAVCPRAFDARALADWLSRFEPTWYSAVPTIHRDVLARCGGTRPRHRLRFVRSGSAALPQQLARDLEHLFGVPVIEFYGMTEAANQIASNPLPPARSKPGSVGLPTNTDVRIDEGEVLVRGETVIRAYAGADAAEPDFVDGWLRTGDLGRLDEDGYLYLEGRKKEIINRGGRKISPIEIEARLLEHPGVAAAAAFPVAHARLGEEPGCVIVAQPGVALDPVAIRDWLAGRLSDFKVPRLIKIIDAIPVGPTGKVRRQELASLVAADERPASPREPLSMGSSDEARLAAIVRDVLGVTALGTDDDFFEAGGDSLTATMLLGRVRNAFNVDVSVVRFLDAPTIAGMSRAIAQSRRVEPPLSPSLVSIQEGVAGPPLFCVPGHDGSLVGFARLARQVDSTRPVIGLSIPPALPATTASIRATALRHVDQIRSRFPDDPYVLIGLCYGGFVAFEIARELSARGARVELLTLLDCANDEPENGSAPARAMRTAVRKVRFHAANLRAAGVRGLGPYLAGRVGALRRPVARSAVHMSGTYAGSVAIFRVPHMRAASHLMGWSGVLRGPVDVHDVPFHARGLLAEPIAPLVAARLRQRLLTFAAS